MMDEQLIDEVAQHSVIYNRQKYYLNSNGSNGTVGKYETKDEAWQIIAMKLRSDVETCKKRWKYLRERYVSQRKQGDPPVYEHLSRPYLEKMKFLDQHIQPRKSYRNVPNFLTSPHSANSSYNGDFNMDTKSNSSHKSMGAGHYGPNNHYNHAQQQDVQHQAMSALSSAASALENANGQVKIEADQMFRDFAAAVASQQLQQISQTQMHHQQAAAVAAAIADSSQSYQDQFSDGNNNAAGNIGVGSAHIPTDNTNTAQTSGSGGGGGIPSSSSSMKSPLSSPLPVGNVNNTSILNGNGATHSSSSSQKITHSSPSSTSCVNQAPAHGYPEMVNQDIDSSVGNNFNMKKPRVQLNAHSSTNCHSNINGNNHSVNFDTDDDSDDNSSSILLQPQALLSEQGTNHQPHQNSTHHFNATGRMAPSNQGQNMFSSNADFLLQLYQQLPHQQPATSHHLSQQQHQQSHYKFQMPHTQTAPAQIERSSEQLLGELVTTELLKMSKERRKHVQKRILEILFFDD